MKEQQAQPTALGFPSTGQHTPSSLDQALLYRIRTAEAKLGVSRSTIYRLVNEGELDLVKIGKRSSGITADSLHALVERNKAVVG